MSVELLYFSELPKICQNLKSRKAAYLGDVFNFIHHLYRPTIPAVPAVRYPSLRRLRSSSPPLQSYIGPRIYTSPS